MGSRLVKGVRTKGETSIITRVHTSSGVKWHELTARSCLDPVSGEPSMLISESDVSELKEAEALAQNMARQDPLTRLPNRLALPSLFKRLRNRADAVGAKLGVLFIDLDQFKAINDTLGHREGDDLLVEVSQRLSGLCGKHDAVVRLGGDEFLFLAKEPVGGRRTLDDVAREISVLLSIVLIKGGRRFTVTPSIGLARYPEHGDDVETLMQCADLAMYKAKLAGRNRVCLFESHMREAMDRQADLLADLRVAFEDGQFEAYYQPRYCPETKRINAVEALAVGPLNARKGITALTLWGGFASTVFIPVIQFLIETQGWRGALLVMAAINMIVCGGLYFLAIDPARDAPLRIVEPDASPPAVGRAAVAAAMKRPSYWGLMIAWVSYAFAFSSLTYHFFPLLLERGLDTVDTVAVLTVIGPAQVAGRILVRAFASEAPVRSLGSAIVIVFPLAVIGFALAPPEVLAIGAVAAFYGAANGMITIVRGMAVPEMVSRDGYGAVNGSLVAPMSVMSALAPLGAALLWQASGGYGAVLVAIFGGSTMLCAGFWFAAWRARM